MSHLAIKPHNTNSSSGHILAAVIIMSIVLMLLGLSILQTVTTVRRTLNDEYRQRAANLAAEAGARYAEYCYRQSGDHQTWNVPPLNLPLKPNTSCTGMPITGASSYVINDTNLRTTFMVGDVSGDRLGVTVTDVSGVTEQLSSSGTVSSTYTAQLKLAMNPYAVGFEQLKLGYTYWHYDPLTDLYMAGKQNMHYVLLDPYGNVLTGGGNRYGVLGSGTTASRLVPAKIVLGTPTTQARAVYTSMTSHGATTFVIAKNGKLWAMGRNDVGQLGNGSSGVDESPTPTQVILPSNQTVTTVESMSTHTYVRTIANNGAISIYGFGSCRWSSLGLQSVCPSQTSIVSTPVRVPELSKYGPSNPDINLKPTDNISFDSEIGLARMEGGALYGWGYNRVGQLGLGVANSTEAKPVRIGNFGNPGYPAVRHVITSGTTTYFYDDTGDIWAAGQNLHGEAGKPLATAQVNTFERIDRTTASDACKDSGPNKKVSSIASDQGNVVFILVDGTVCVLGQNNIGQLGQGHTSDVTPVAEFPLPVGVKGIKAVAPSLGNDLGGNVNNVFVLGSDGRIYGAGSNAYGQLGIGNTVNQSTPQVMDVIDGSNIRAVDIMSGFGTTIILAHNGAVYSVGNNEFGQLGIGNTDNKSTPVKATLFMPNGGSHIF